MSEQHQLLLEIGTEEIPARFGQPALDQLKTNAAKALQDARLTFRNIQTFGTPRRLILYVEGIAAAQPDLEVVEKGPPRRIAFTPEGEPTLAAQKFAEKQGVAVTELRLQADEKGVEYIQATRHEKGRTAIEVLPPLLAELVVSIRWAKSMRWAEHTISYARPIKWLLAMFDHSHLDLNVDGIKSGKTTLGHRVLGSSEPIPVTDPTAYFSDLRAAFVIYDQEERRKSVWRQIEDEGKRLGGYVPEDEDLLEEITWLVEYPTAFSGSFDPDFLDVPSMVLVTTMKENQRYFSVYTAPESGEEGHVKTLLAHFIAVRNGNTDYLDIVRAGNEKVLAARLSDARFFWDEDRKQPLASYKEKLKSAVFQEKLGTQFARVERIKLLTEKIAEMLNLTAEETGYALEAADLCKADLVTRMVFEFPEVQGYMGQQYFARAGGNPAVALAIYEHYLPRGASDDLPRSKPGITVALADKLDTLAGYFAIDKIPSGSQDPYALRRSAQGVIQTIVENELHLDIGRLVRGALEGYMLDEQTAQKTEKDLREFLKARLRVLLEGRNLRYDVIDAVISAATGNYVVTDDATDALIRGEVLASLLNEADFAAVTIAFKRVVNLAGKAEEVGVPPGNPDPSLFLETHELALYNAFHDLFPGMEQALLRREYKEFYEQALNLKGPVDMFLDKVLVNTTDEQVRNNRYRLLVAVGSILAAPANLGKLVG